MTRKQALDALKVAKENLAAAQLVMYDTAEYKATMVALQLLYAARYDYCVAYHTANPQGDQK